jgi:hypothetical protein
LNSRPIDYESIALPTELLRPEGFLKRHFNIFLPDRQMARSRWECSCLYKLPVPGYNSIMILEKRQVGFKECRQRQHDLVAYLNRFSGL